MSVVATYVRVSGDALIVLREDVEWIETIHAGRVPSAQVLDIDNACDGIVWLLSRMPLPSAQPVAGSGFVVRRSLVPLLRGAEGAQEPHLEAPVGAASVLAPEQVNEVSGWLGSIDFSQLRARYDPQAMDSAGIHPQIWIEEGVAALDDYLLPHLDHLRKFFAEAATAKQCVVVFFT
jgi:hypothetical protein